MIVSSSKEWCGGIRWGAVSTTIIPTGTSSRNRVNSKGVVNSNVLLWLSQVCDEITLLARSITWLGLGSLVATSEISIPSPGASEETKITESRYRG